MEKKIYTVVACDVETGATEKLLGVYSNISLMLKTLKKEGYDLETTFVKKNKRSVVASALNLGKCFKKDGHASLFKHNNIQNEKPLFKIAMMFMNKIYSK